MEDTTRFLKVEAMIQRFQERAKAVRKRNMPPVAGAERAAFIKQAELDFQDFAMIADAEISMDGGILTIDLRPAICDAAIRGMAPLERETQVAMENISKSEHRTYDDIMNAQREQRADRAREALIEDPDRPSLLGEFMDLAEQRRDADVGRSTDNHDHAGRSQRFRVIDVEDLAMGTFVGSLTAIRSIGP